MKENHSKPTPIVRKPTANAPTYRKIENPRKTQYPEFPGAKTQNTLGK